MKFPILKFIYLATYLPTYLPTYLMLVLGSEIRALAKTLSPVHTSSTFCFGYFSSVLHFLPGPPQTTILLPLPPLVAGITTPHEANFPFYYS
jgi:hypothetical protein